MDITQPDRFTPRGNVTISSINTGSFTSSQEPLKSAERNQLQALANANQFYRLKAIVTSQDGERQTFLTYSKAVSCGLCVVYKTAYIYRFQCALAGSQLNDVLWVNVGHVGAVLGISQTISGSANCLNMMPVNAEALDEFNTDVYVKHTEMAPM